MKYSAPAGTTIGHVHLKVSDLERSIAFYRDVLGFEVTQLYGQQAAFLSAGGYHHHIGLNTWMSKGGPPSPLNAVGLFHTAILLPTRRDFAAAVKNVLEHGIAVNASDHGVSEAVYFSDPDENGIELYWDKPREEWPFIDGKLEMVTERLDLESLLAELNS